MKSIIKQLLRENLLDEAMLNSSNLSPETALFSLDGKLALSLYDPIAKHVFGAISASLRGQNYDVDVIAAESGFGPYMYELAMMAANEKGKGIMPTRNGDIRASALKVWTKFYDRSDVRKESIEPFDANGKWNPEYSVALYTGNNDTFESPEEFQEWWDSINPKTQEVLKKYNTVYYMQPNQYYKELLNRGKVYIKKGFNPRTAITAGNNLFMQKYN